MGKQFRMDVPKGELQEILDDLKLEPKFRVVSQDERDGIVVLIVENTTVAAPPPPPPAANEPSPPPPPPGGTIKAKPGSNEAVINAIIAGAVVQGINPMTALTIVAIESNFNPTICNRSTSAAGLYQFLDKTWATASGGLTFPGRGGKNNGQAAGASVNVQVNIGSKFLKGISSRLEQALGHTPSATEIYILHQQGDGGGMKILRGDQNAPITSVISADAARLNGFAGMTIGQTIAAFDRLVQKKAVVANAQVIAGQASPAGGTTPSGGGNPGATAAQSIRSKVVDLALAERSTFALKNGNVVTETQEPLSSRVLQYFAFVNRPDIKKPDAEPWSAAFISFVIKNAGATDDQFPTSQNHAKYILAGLANRIKNQLEAPIVYFDRNEMTPQVGDLVGFSRDSSVKNRADIERFLPNQFFASHTDLVIETSAGTIKAIGGNVSQTIKITTIKADATGKIDPSAQHFFVLRLNV